jgi:outer membrane lipopolysaccharide assembly protein LptE/RlpB
MSRLRLVLLIGSIGLLTACGFQLRGFAPLAVELQRMELDDKTLNRSQQVQLRKSLERAGVTVLDRTGSDFVKLRVTFQDLPERRLLDSASSDKIVIRLTRQLNFTVTYLDPAKQPRPGRLTEQFDIELSEDDLAGKDRELVVAGTRLDRLLINKLMFQLRRL